MSSRIDGEATCLRCGGIVININPRLKMCSECEKKVIETAKKRIANRKEPTSLNRYRIKLPRMAGVLGKK